MNNRAFKIATIAVVSLMGLLAVRQAAWNSGLESWMAPAPLGQFVVALRIDGSYSQDVVLAAESLHAVLPSEPKADGYFSGFFSGQTDRLLDSGWRRYHRQAPANRKFKDFASDTSSSLLALKDSGQWMDGWQVHLIDSNGEVCALAE